jgi:hypothetical protein
MINKFELVRRILADFKVNPERLALEWVSAAEAPRFVNVITDFTNRIQNLGALGSSEGLDSTHLNVKLKAAKMALESKRVRMAFARQAKYKKHEGSYRQIPEGHKLHGDLEKTLQNEMVVNRMLLYLSDRPRNVAELAGLLDVSSDDVVAHFKKLEKKGLVLPDQLMAS